jgi:hypothetical protein
MRQLTEPNIDGATLEDWQTFLLRTTFQGGGFMLLGVANMDNSGAPFIELGSRLEINGAFYKSVSNESISGGVAEGANYVYAIPSGGGVYFQYSAAKPAWNAPKGRWYSGNNRAVLRLRYREGQYLNKKIVDFYNYDLEDKLSGFDIPPDDTARTLVFSKTDAGEGSVTLDEGIYEVRMRGGLGGKGGVSYSNSWNGGSQGQPGTPTGDNGGSGTNSSAISGFLKIISTHRNIYFIVGSNGGAGNSGGSGSAEYGGGGGNGIDGGGNGGQWGSRGSSGVLAAAADTLKYPVQTKPGRGGNGGDSKTNSFGTPGGGGGGGGGGGLPSGISESLQFSGFPKPPAGTGGAVEIYKVDV